MKISIITLFPEMFSGVFSSSIIKRAQEEKKVTIKLVNLRDFGIGRHKIVDDRPYGGGVGMVLKVDVVDRAIQNSKKLIRGERVILLDPKGEVYKQEKAEKFSMLTHLILVCGHYEGFDDRIRKLVDETISIGDFVLSGGEVAAMVVVESVIRLIPGVIKKKDAIHFESFSKGNRILEYPHYTRPRAYKRTSVPKILLSGHRQKIEKARAEQSVLLTKKLRPDLFDKSAKSS